MKKYIITENQFKRYLSLMIEKNYRPLGKYCVDLTESELKEINLSDVNKMIERVILSEERGVPDFMDGLVSKIVAYVEKQSIEYEEFGYGIERGKITEIPSYIFKNTFLDKPIFDITVFSLNGANEFNFLTQNGYINNYTNDKLSTLTNGGNYLSGVKFFFTLVKINNRFQPINFSWVSHEILHAYEKYCRLKNGEPIDIDRIINDNEIYNYLKNSYKPRIQSLGDMLYVSLPYEQSAFINQSFFQLKEVEANKFNENYKNTEIYGFIDKLQKMVDSILNKFTDDEIIEIRRILSDFDKNITINTSLNVIRATLAKIMTNAAKKYKEKFFKTLSLYYDQQLINKKN